MNFDEYRESCNQVVRHYHSDIDIDVQMMQEGIVGVYWADEMGTHSAPLFSVDQLPARGEKRRYLFGEADARTIANNAGAIMPKASEKAIWHYFNGSNIRLIDAKEAQVIVDNYLKSVTALFDDRGYPYP